MMLNRRLFLIIAALSSASVAVACGRDDSSSSADDDLREHFGEEEIEFVEGGSDADHDIDPVRDDPTIFAVSAVTRLFSWKPREMASVYDLSDQTRDEVLTGDAYEKYLDATSEEAMEKTPAEWEDYAVSGAQFSVIANDSKIIQDSADSTKTVRVLFQQWLTENADRSLFAEYSADLSLTVVDGHWKAQSIVVGDV